MATKVEPMTLIEVAPQLVRVETGLNPYFSSEKESVVSTTKTFFNRSLVKEETLRDPNHKEAPRILDEQSWNAWKGPEITIPDFTDSSVMFPDIREEVYATSRVDGRPLVAYGVICSSYGNWSYKWTRDNDEVLRLIEAATTQLAELRAKWALRDSFMGEISQINEEREAVSLPKLEAKNDGFMCWSRTLDYTHKNLDFARAEVKCKKIFDDLNAQRRGLGLSALSLDSDGEFSLDGYKRLTEDNLDLVRQDVVLEQEKSKRAQAEVEFDKLNERRAKLGMSTLVITSEWKFFLRGYHKFELENLQLIRDDIAKKEREIEEQERKREARMTDEEARRIASNPFGKLAQLRKKIN